jgi:hypothetical protein
MKLSDLYSRYILDWLSSGGLIARDKISSIGIKPSFDRILTKKYVTKVWQVVSVPIDFSQNLTELIRVEMSVACPTVKTTVYMINVPTNINVTSDTFTRALSLANDKADSFDELFSSLSEKDRQIGKTFQLSGGRKYTMRKSDGSRLKYRKDSYNYVYSHTLNGGEFTKSYIFVHAQSEDNADLKQYRKKIGVLFRSRQIIFNELSGNMSNYLTNFGPATYTQGDVRRFPTVLTSDENMASMVPYRTQGLVGGKGILMGVDMKSRFPLILDFFASPSAQILLWVAMSGEGKTLAAQAAALSFMGDHHHVSVTDIKGGEWEKLSVYVNTLVISMDDVNPRFVNTMRIDDMEVTKENCYFTFRNAVTGTVQLFCLMINLLSKEGNISDLEGILEEAIIKVYNKHNVYPNNPRTFINSKTIKFSEVIEPIIDLKKSSSYTDEKKKLCTLAADRLSTYFRSEGRYADAFRNEVTLAEVINTPLIIYSFNKNANTMLDTMDSLRVFMSQFLSLKKQFYRKNKGLHTVDYYEELQRSDQFGNLLKVIAHATTGSRSNNVVINLLLNTLSAFDNPGFKAIESNITTVVCGKVQSIDIEYLIKMGHHQIIPDVQKISYDTTLRYKNNFAVSYNTGAEIDSTIYKVMLPDYMEKQLRTRDVVPS